MTRTRADNEGRRPLRFWAPLFALTGALWLLTNACGSGDSSDPEVARPADPTAPAAAAPPADNPERLSDWDQLSTRDGRLVLAVRVVPYSLNSALFSDHAHKLRTIQLPEGAEPADYDADDVFAFPVGTAFFVLAAILWWRNHQTPMSVMLGWRAATSMAERACGGKATPPM